MRGKQKFLNFKTAHKNQNTFKMRKTQGKNKRLQLLVNQNHGLDNKHQNLPKRSSQYVLKKTTICFIKH